MIAIKIKDKHIKPKNKLNNPYSMSSFIFGS